LTVPLETTKFDGARHLATMEEQFAYLEATLDQSDPSFIATAIGDVARAASASGPRDRLEPRSDLQGFQTGRPFDDRHDQGDEGVWA
jgi:hypothetical protein